MMDSLIIKINEQKKEFVLSGNTNQLITNRRARYYFLDYLNAIFQDDHKILVPYEADEREQTLKKVHSSLEKYSIQYSDSSEIIEIVDWYYQEKQNFIDFSLRAKSIWENNVDVDNFEDFTEILKTHLSNRTLYDKQLLAAYHLAFAQNACNFSVPGAGKTSVVYGAYTFLKNLPDNDSKKVNKLLIIGPLSSFGPWEDEYEECFGQKVKSIRLSGGVSINTRERHLLSTAPIEDIPELTLMSYQSIFYNLDNLKHFLQRTDIKAMVVLDEAHKIKNVEGGVWANSALQLARMSGVRSRVVLTGTPVPNGYEDIYNLYDFIWPDKDIINFTVFQLKDMSSNRFDPRINNLIESISPFFIRIKKGDILPPARFPVNDNDPIVVPMGNTQRRIYDFIERRYIGYFEDNYDVANIAAELTKARFVRLMQAATNPNLLQKPLEEYFAHQGLSSDLYIDDSELINSIINYNDFELAPKKFEIIRDLTTSLLAKNEKVLIWGTFTQNLLELQKFLSDFGIEVRLLYGAVPTETDDLSSDVITREKIIREFHSPDSSFKVIIANPFAVSESISLHKACHNAIYFERTFNASNFIQSKDRIHRVGLPEGTVTHYHYILSENSIDETIHQRLIEKERRMLELIESQEIPLISENLNYDIDLEDDLKAIIRDYVRRITQA